MAWPKGVPRKPKESEPEVQVEEGAAVPMPDAGPALYRDRAGIKLGGGPMEGTSYAGEIARQAVLTIERLEAERAAAEERGTSEDEVE